jgi:hypothetical protein
VFEGGEAAKLFSLATEMAPVDTAGVSTDSSYR